MMKDDSYFKQVNRRLVGAHFLLSSADDSILKTNPVGHQVLLDSALLQFYFAVFSYLNELLQYYRKPVMDTSVLDLSSVLSKPSEYFEGIHEFVVLQKWSQENDNILLKLASLPSDAIQLSSEKKEQDKVTRQEPENVSLLSKPSDLIAVNEVSGSLDLNDLVDAHTIKTMLTGFQSLIDSQRENQLEY